MTLVQLLHQHRGQRHRMQPPRLTLKKIRDWAQMHYQRTGSWPTQKSGPVIDAPGEKWGTIDEALRCGKRGLNGGTTLYRYLKQTVMC